MKNRFKIEKEEWMPLVIVLAVYLLGAIVWLLFRGNISDDEFYTLRDTFGILHTGKAYQWDFYIQNITDVPTTKQLDFLLLAGWIRLLGDSPLAMRFVSMIYGIGAIVSFYWVVKKLTGEIEWTFWTVLVLAVDPVFVMLSANIRGYTLLLLLNVWIFYFLYRALEEYSLKKTVVYGGISLPLIYAAYRIRVFELIYVACISIYIIVRAIWTKEKKYVMASAGVGVGIIVLWLSYVLRLGRYIPFIDAILGGLEGYCSFGWNEPLYIKDMLDIFACYPITLLGFLLALYVLSEKDVLLKEQKKVMVYALSLVSGIILFFVFVTDWMHDEKYLLVMHPAMILFVIGGFLFACKGKPEKVKGIAIGILICVIGINIYGNVINAMDNGDEDFEQAYGIIADYVKEYAVGIPFLTGREIREYYAKDIIGEHIWETMPDDEGEDASNIIGNLSIIAERYPQGIIVSENRKLGAFSYYSRHFLNSGAVEKISGEGLDDTKINSWAYHVIKAEQGEITGEKIPVIFGWNFGGNMKITEEENKTIMEIEVNGAPSEEMLLCVKVNQFYSEDSRQRYIQLLLEPTDQSKLYYRIELQNEEKAIRSDLDETYYIFNGLDETREYGDCYTL